MGGAKQKDVRSLCQELTDQVISLYVKANKQFIPGENMIGRDSIINKIEREWRRALDIVNNKVKGVQQKKVAMEDKLDKIFSVLLCQCNILTCQEEGCSEACKKGVHITCLCPKVQKLPVIELLFIRDQRKRAKGGLGIGPADHKESAKMVAKQNRKIRDENIQTKKAAEEKTYEYENRVIDSDLALQDETADENSNYIDENLNDQDFVTQQLREGGSQNRIDLTNLARESLRNGVSVRAAASLATGLLIDLKLATKEDAHLVIDPMKIQRAREKVMKAEKLEALSDIKNKKLDCIFFDGRRDKTKMLVVDSDGDEFARTESEEHYTLTDPHNYLTHVTPEEGTGARGTAQKVVEYLTEVDQLENVTIIGGDSTSSNTGWKEGAIHHIEVAKGEKVLWDICMLHTNELPLRHVMKNLGMETSGANSFVGELGDLIKDDVHLYEVDEKFEVLEFGHELRDIPDSIVEDLSTDQKYFYKIVKMVLSGDLDHDVLKQVVGPVNHSRWLTTACRLCRLWVSKHTLRKNSVIYKNLKIIISFIVSVYAVMWFEIKCRSNILHGPRHMLKAVQLVDMHCPVKLKAVVEEVMQRGGWHAHSENLLLSLLGSEDEEERKFAVDIIKKVRGDSEFGDKSVRDFHVPLLNFKANSLFNLIDMSDIANIHEPVQTCQISTNELDQFLLCPFPSPDVECHTQSCERAVKETTIAASKVFGFERRDGYIRAKMKSRKLVPSVKSKKSLAGMIV